MLRFICVKSCVVLCCCVLLRFVLLCCVVVFVVCCTSCVVLIYLELYVVCFVLLFGVGVSGLCMVV